METVILTLALILVAMAGLAIGMLFGRPPVKGSCGGLNCGDCACGQESER